MACLGTVQAIMMQRGCEDFDPAVRSDGKLTHLMDVIIFG